MCTLAILRRPGHDWPILVGSNRDELRSRKWKSPGRHWINRPDTLGGLDEEAGGTWLALNDNGVIAALLNRRDSLGPANNKRSRGELPLEAVDHAEAEVSASNLSKIRAESYKAFNLIIADSETAFWLQSSGKPNSLVTVLPIPAGFSMITAYDLNDFSCPRIRANFRKFETAEVPDPGKNEWDSWTAILSSRNSDGFNEAEGAMNLGSNTIFGTVSSSLIGLPNIQKAVLKPKWLFSAGKPDEDKYFSINI